MPQTPAGVRRLEERVTGVLSHASARRGAGLSRGVEAVLGMAGLIVAAPLIAVGAAAVLATSGAPVFFRQVRIGKDGRPFTLVKLRTMHASPGGPRVTSRGDHRVTRVGALLRRTKLDELPELWNIVKGDMSFVGPRPEVPEYVDLGDSAWQEVLRVRPGLTDPVTLGLRDEESLMGGVRSDRDRYYREVLLPEKLRGSAEYLRQRSWRSDLCILAQTGLAVLCPPLGRYFRPRVDLPERPATR